MSGQYAVNTDVSVERSKAEIETVLQRYGADAFMHGWDNNRAMLQFRASERMVRFVLPLPDRASEEFTQYAKRTNQHAGGTKTYARTPEDAHRAWEQACRQRWRALCLCIKAKLEAVACEITTFEEEFMAHIVLPNGETAGTWMHPQIEEAYASGKMPAMLPMLPHLPATKGGKAK